MKPRRVIVSVIVALVVVVSAACGGSDQSVPDNAVAVVDGMPVTKAQLDSLLVRAKNYYATNKRAFPKAGTAEYQNLQSQGVEYLVKRAEVEVEAKNRKITVTDKELDEKITQLKASSYDGSQAKLVKDIKAQGYTFETFRDDLRQRILSEKIYAAITKDAKVTDAQIATYYAAHKTEAPISVTKSRDVRHILVKTKPEADRIYNELKGGADFTKLVKKYSIDTGSVASGGVYTVTPGRMAAPFEAASYTLKTNEISHPVKTQFGYHLIQPTSPLRPATTLSLKAARPQIQDLLLNQAKQSALTKWTNESLKKLDAKVVYAVGYAPPAAATDTTTTG